MAKYLKTSKTVTVKDYYGSEWTQIKAEVSVAAGTSDTNSKVSYTITSTNDRGGSHWHCNGVYIKIGSEVICDGSYYTTTSSFPNTNNSKETGSFNTKSGSVKITIKLCCQQDGRVGDRWTDGTATVKSETLTRTTWTNVGEGTVSIKDNGNNTFTLKGAKGADGTNNDATGPTLTWGYSNKYGTSFKNGDKVTLTMSDKTNATRTVYAKCITGATHGDGNSVTASKAIKQYVAPSNPSGVKLTYKRARLTIKENWTASWTASTKTNDSSPVKGYRIRIYKNGKTIQFKNSEGDILTSDSGSGDSRYYYDRDKTETTMNINTKTNTFKPGDKVQLMIHGYTEDAKGNKKFSDKALSSTYTVQNAGVMNTKTKDGWKEGQVWVKTKDGWKEAVAVHVKTKDGWKESI